MLMSLFAPKEFSNAIALVAIKIRHCGRFSFQ
jgi:hypothetical protein